MSTRRWPRLRRRRSRREPEPTHLPRPERDPYFNRMAGADQVPVPLPTRRDATVVDVPSPDDPEIVRDFRIRGDIIAVERGFRIAGRTGFLITFMLFVVLAFQTVQTCAGRDFLGDFDGLDSRERYVRAGWLLVGIAIASAFAWSFRVLVRGHPWSRAWLSATTAAPLIGSAFLPDALREAPIVIPAALIALGILWNKRARRFFQPSYRLVIERTPAFPIRREMGRGRATLFLTAICIVEAFNGFLILSWLGSR